jgi:hypothetical protein
MDLSLLTTLDPDTLPDEQLRPTLRAVLNVVEALLSELQSQRETIQQLRDEINRLKGEQGQPTIKPSRRPPGSAGSADYSSEQERRQPKAWQKRPKLERLTITHTETLRVDRANLPADAEFKGTEWVTVQELVLQPRVIHFEQEVWYSPSQRKTYRPTRPAGFEGEFGPGIKALGLTLHYGANVTQPKLLEFFRNAGIELSDGWLANLLSRDAADFAAEATAVERAGLASSPWQHSDTSGTRVDGEAWHCHVLGNPLYTAYHTLPKKDRLAVLAALRGGGELAYRWDATADAYLDRVGLSGSARRRLSVVPRDQELDEASLTGLLEPLSRWVGPQQQTWFREALALAAYQAQTDWPVILALLCDDAAQYRLVTDALGLCWIHEGRHYKKLVAHLPLHRALVEAFRGKFWDYYDELLAYRQQPSAAEAQRLEQRFDELFATESGFRLLDERIALTREKKAGLLLVLQHPELPLHNNPAELAVRRRVRKRDASFGPRSAAGAKAWDTFHTLAATTQQLGLSFYGFIRDRLTKAGQVPPLADLITERAQTLNLGASWAGP